MRATIIRIYSTSMLLRLAATCRGESGRTSSTLEDTIEDRSAQAGTQPDEDMAIQVLKDMGPPIIFAENYRENDYLISPAVFPVSTS